MIEVRPLWNYVTVQNGYAFDSQLFSDTGDIPLARIRDILSSEFETFISRETVPSDDYVIQDGDLVIGMDGDFNSVIWKRGEAALNQRVCVVRPHENADIRFVHYAMMKPLKTVNDLRYSTTVKHLSQDDIYSMRVPLPDLAGQQRIADYLDRETAEIDAAVADLDKYVELLEKRHLEMIRHKTQFDSHGSTWKRCSTSILFRSIGGGTTPKKDMDYYTSNEDANGIPWVTTSELRESVLQTTKVSVTPKALREVPSLRIHPTGSVAIAMYGATIGRLGILGIPATTNQACCVFSEPRGLDLKFFYYSLWADRDAIIRYSSGGGQPNISQAILQRWKTPLPPLEAQREIVDYLDRETAEIDTLITESTRLRNLLLKRRSILITEVITGRKQV